MFQVLREVKKIKTETRFEPQICTNGLAWVFYSAIFWTL